MAKNGKLVDAIKNVTRVSDKLSKVVLDDIDDPNYVIICSKEYLDRLTKHIEVQTYDDVEEARKATKKPSDKKVH